MTYFIGLRTLSAVSALCFIPVAAYAAAGPAVVECGDDKSGSVRLVRQQDDTYKLSRHNVLTSAAYVIRNLPVDENMTCRFAQSAYPVLRCESPVQVINVDEPRSGTTKSKTVQGVFEIKAITSETRSVDDTKSETYLELSYEKGKYGIGEKMPVTVVEAEDIDVPSLKRKMQVYNDFKWDEKISACKIAP